MIKKEQYSFSKLSSFETCPYGWYQTYILHKRGEGNAFSSYGSEIHSICERYAKGELLLDVLPEVYKWEFDSAVPELFPFNKHCDLRETYYSDGLRFLSEFKGYPKGKILGIEEEFLMPVDDWMFKGFIDLIIEQDGKLIVQDYKSKAKFVNKTEQQKYARQLYAYSLYVKNRFGRFPDILRFYMFRKGNIVDIPFNYADFNEAVLWMKKTVELIRKCWVFEPKCDLFYSQNLCNHRAYCELKTH